MPRVLVIDEALPHPPDSGKRIRTWELLTRLTDAFDVTLAYHDEGATPPEAEAAARDAGLHLLPVPRTPLKKRGLRFGWDLARNLLLPVPYMVMAHRTQALMQAVRQAHAMQPFDVAHVEWTPLVANLGEDWPTPVCIAAHNVESDIWRRYLENEQGFARRRYIAVQYRKVQRFEQRALRDVDAVTAVSVQDAARIQAWAQQDDVVVVPNGVNATYFAPQPDTPRDPERIVFVGSLDWRPNLDGIVWFLDEVLDPLRAQRPGVQLSIVGRNPPRWLEERVEGLGGVTVHGSVPDVRPFVAGASVSAVPLRIGGGSRLKICESLAMQTPVVSTAVGAEGLTLPGGVVIADEPAAFAAALAEALEDPVASMARAHTGREQVLARYEWDTIAPMQAALWQRLAGAGA